MTGNLLNKIADVSNQGAGRGLPVSDTVVKDKGSVRQHTQELERRLSSKSLLCGKEVALSVGKQIERPDSLRNLNAYERTQSLGSFNNDVFSPLESNKLVESNPEVFQDSPVCGFKNQTELTPAVEKIISKSPSLRRKVCQEEVVACHSPDEQKLLVSKAAEGQSKGYKVTEGQGSKVKVNKSVSVPIDVPCAARKAQGYESDKCMFYLDSPSTESSSKENTQVSECSKGLVTSLLETFTKEKQAAVTKGQSLEGNEKGILSGAVKQNTQIFEPKLQHRQLKRTKSGLVERSHSFGSQIDSKAQRRSLADFTNVGRSSSFKETSPTKSDTKSIGTYPWRLRAEKQVVIIPKSTNSSHATKKTAEGVYPKTVVTDDLHFKQIVDVFESETAMIASPSTPPKKQAHGKTHPLSKLT
jgi:hypothetical protein